MSLSGTVIRLDQLLLLQAQALKLFYSPDTSETADAMRQIVNLSSEMLEPSTRSPSEKASGQDGIIGGEENGTVGSPKDHAEVSAFPSAEDAAEPKFHLILNFFIASQSGPSRRRELLQES